MIQLIGEIRAEEPFVGNETFNMMFYVNGVMVASVNFTPPPGSTTASVVLNIFPGSIIISPTDSIGFVIVQSEGMSPFPDVRAKVAIILHCNIILGD